MLNYNSIEGMFSTSLETNCLFSVISAKYFWKYGYESSA